MEWVCLILGLGELWLIARVWDLRDELTHERKEAKVCKDNFESRIDALERGEFKDYGTTEDKPGH